jgi:acyl-CoA thioesterase
MDLPFVEHVGLQFVERGDGMAVWDLLIQPEHFNGAGVVHGGAIFTLADTCMGSALYALLDRSEACATVELKISYFKPVTAGSLRCRSQVVHRGRTLAHLDATVHCGKVLVGKANGTFAIYPRRPPAAAAASSSSPPA